MNKKLSLFENTKFTFSLSVLFPVYYLLELQNEFKGVLNYTIILQQFLIWSTILMIFQFIVFRFLKKPFAAALLTFFLATIYFYAYPIAVFFKSLPAFSKLQHFSILLPIWVALTILLAYILKRKQTDTVKTGQWLLITCFVLVLYEAGSLLYLYSSRENRNFIKDYQPENPIQHVTKLTNETKPDIFFLIYDSYTSNRVLIDRFGYSNTSLDSFLISNNFQIAKNARSNYYLTPVSLAATLNLNYLPNIRKYANQNDLILLSGLKNIDKNHLFTFLKKESYQIINITVFSVDNQHPPQLIHYAGSKDRDLILMRTLENTSIKPLLNRLFKKNLRFSDDPKAQQLLNHIDLVNSSLTEKAVSPNQKPRFFFIYIAPPHSPYIFKKDGSIRKSIINDPTDQNAYLEQLIATNNHIKMTVTRIRKQNPNAIIIIQGDHGFRFFPDSNNRRDAFGVLHAVCFPGKEYTTPHDSMTSVNTFRIVLNTYFHQNMPLLPDSTFYPETKLHWEEERH